MKKVAPLRYDVIFKKAFTPVDIFKAFVKDIIGIELDIQYVETEKRFDTPIGNVTSRFDLFAEDVTNRTIVDIQHARFDDHYDRFLHYHCAALLEQATSADNYRPDKRVFTIVVLTSGDRHKHDVSVIDFDPKTLKGKPLGELEHRVIYLYPKYVNDDTPENYKEWLRAIDDSLDGIVDETAYQHPEIQKIFGLIENDLISPDERARMKDEYNHEQLQRQQFEEGVAQGKTEGVLQTVRSFKQAGVAIEVIIQATGLSREEIEGLDKQ